MPAPARSVYYGAYLRFSTADKKSGSVIAGPDTAIGDIGTIVWDLDEHQRQRQCKRK